MESKKIILNRAELSSNSIQKREDFNSILTRVELLKNPNMKRPWFYGAIGLTSIANASIIYSFFKQLNE